MKKMYILAALVLMILFAGACNVHAQYATKNTIEAGGSISYSSTTAVANGTAAGESTSFLQFMPFINYFITDGWSVGLIPGINIIKFAGASESTKNYSIFLAPGYTFRSGGSLFPYVEALVGYTALQQDASGSTAATDLSGISFGARGGAKVAVGNSGLFNLGISYIMLNLSPKGADKRSGYNNLSLTAGFSIFIKR